jgi:hypothetical protein
MRTRTDPASRSERVASIAAATAITLGAAVLVFAPMRPRRVAQSVASSVHNAKQVAEHLEYAIARAPASSVAPVVLPTPPRSRVQSQNITKSPAQERHTDSVASVSEAGPVPPLAGPKIAAPSWWSTIGRAPAFGSAKGPFHRDAEPMDFDSALRVVRDSLEAEFAAGRPRPVPLTQAERDAQWRAQALAAFAERTNGDFNPRTISGGASVPIGLPFGGPSHETRERDRAIFAQDKEIQARIQRRVDSTLAARRQRHADSLARVDHAMRPELSN